MKKFKNSRGERASSKKKSRKEIRKVKRDAKKQHRRDYYNRHKKSAEPHLYSTENHETKTGSLKHEMVQRDYVPPSRKSGSENERKEIWKNGSIDARQITANNMPNRQNKLNSKKVYNDPLVARKLQEEAAHKDLQKAMRETRNQQLSEANEEDEKLIKKLEKQLKLSKRKSKTLPKSFAADGLDYILDVCDSEKIKQVASIEKAFDNSDSELEEDLALIALKKDSSTRNKQPNSMVKQNGFRKDNSESEFDNSDSELEEDFTLIASKKDSSTRNKQPNSMLKQNGARKDNENPDDYYSSDCSVMDSEISNNESDDFLDAAEGENIDEDDNDCVNYNLSCSQEEKYAISFENQRLLKVHISDDLNEKADVNGSGTGSFEMKRKRVTFKGKEEEEDDDDDEDKSSSRNKCIENNCKKSFKKIKTSQEMKCASDVMYSSQPNVMKSKVFKNGIEKPERFVPKADVKETSTASLYGADGDDNEAKDNNRSSSVLMNNLSPKDDNLKRIGNKTENVIQDSSGVSAYVPPKLRTESASDDSLQRLRRLKRRIKGLLNRLSERNLCSISKEVSELYHDADYSRNDMNTTLTNAIMESLVTTVLSLERLVMEHVALIAYLHYNEGSEVGAFILQTFVKKFDTLFNTNPDIENKELDNVILIMCFFYHFKVVHARLLFDMLSCLADRFGPKDVELILMMLRSVAFILRKDDPSRMKLLMIQLQELANSSLQKCNEPRIKFMLEVLVAVKNNNMARLPGWDPTPVDNMRKLLRSLPCHQNSTSSELNISLKDILAADERGRWWVIGSAWVGQGPTESELPATKKVPSYSAELLDLAEKMRMNTSIRRNIFCILMSSQDCNEAVGNIMQMGLKGIQAREIIHVTLDCCLQEKQYNQFYSFVLQNFCDRDRMFKITLQRDFWTKFDDLRSLTPTQFTNMVILLHQLLNQEVIDLFVFKVIDFTQLEKPAVRLLRQVLLGILSGDEQVCNQVFASVTKKVKHKMFCQKLHLFLQQFVLSRMGPEDSQKLFIQDRVNNVFLATCDL